MLSSLEMVERFLDEQPVASSVIWSTLTFKQVLAYQTTKSSQTSQRVFAHLQHHALSYCMFSSMPRDEIKTDHFFESLILKISTLAVRYGDIALHGWAKHGNIFLGVCWLQASLSDDDGVCQEV